MNRRLRAARTALIALAVPVLAGLLGGAPAQASSRAGGDPATNIAPVPAIAGSICDSQPQGTACLTRVVQALDHARGLLGLPAYALPDRFAWLSPREKLLVLVNQDRRAEGLSPVFGMNAYLDANASAAIRRRSDPDPVSSLAGAHWLSWAANWAGGNGAFESPTTAQYFWMYYDGLNANGSSWNLLCTRATPEFCWKHRQNVLLPQGGDQQLAVGLAGGPDGRGWWGFTQLFETVPRSAPVNYVPTVVRASTRIAHHTGGSVVTVSGFGFVHVREVRVLGSAARVLSATPWTMRIAIPAHAPGYGHIVVTTGGGTSSLNYAAGFRYVP